MKRRRTKSTGPVSRHRWVLPVISDPDVEVWVETLGDSGILFYGHARSGVHFFRTGETFSTRVGAIIAALGLLQAWYAEVTARHGDKETWGHERPPTKRERARMAPRGDYP